jgi:hypothetical protein
MRKWRAHGSWEYDVLMAHENMTCSWLMKIWRAHGSWEYDVLMAHENMTWSWLMRIWRAHGSWEYDVLTAHENMTCSWLMRIWRGHGSWEYDVLMVHDNMTCSRLMRIWRAHGSWEYNAVQHWTVLCICTDRDSYGEIHLFWTWELIFQLPRTVDFQLLEEYWVRWSSFVVIWRNRKVMKGHNIYVNDF